MPKKKAGKKEEKRREKKVPNPNKTIIIVAVSVCVVAAVAFGIWQYMDRPKKKPVSPAKVSKQIKPKQVIDYGKMGKGTDLKNLMDQRKEDFGVGDGLDIIAKSDESLKIGESTVAMVEIMEKIQLKIGDIVESNIGPSGDDAPTSIEDFGIYVVQPNDNIWNVHFRFLKDYFDRKGVSLSPLSDEPKARGLSSGVGKLLKFSENIVHIYNMEKRELDIDLNMIHPLTKLVIYNMDRIFALLDQIDYSKVDHIQFDGETLWLPAEE